MLKPAWCETQPVRTALPDVLAHVFSNQNCHAHQLDIICLKSICRHRFWWSYVDEIRKQRDNPQQPDQRTAANSRAAERDRSRNAKDTGDVVDKAYVREYLEPEQKRMRRDLGL